MKNAIAPIVLLTALLCGCAHDKQAQTKPIFQRPWVGGHFEDVPTPASVRTNHSRFGKRGALITRLEKETPLENAGLQESDVILAINGAKVHYAQQITDAIEKNGMTAATFSIYRNGDVLEKTVNPGIERYQKIHSIVFALGFTTHFDVDIYPNPDFSLIAIGYETKHDRLDLRDPKSKYLKDLAAKENKPQTQEGWKGMRSDEGSKFWLGPFWFTQNKTILSQE